MKIISTPRPSDKLLPELDPRTIEVLVNRLKSRIKKDRKLQSDYDENDPEAAYADGFLNGGINEMEILLDKLTTWQENGVFQYS